MDHQVHCTAISFGAYWLNFAAAVSMASAFPRAPSRRATTDPDVTEKGAQRPAHRLPGAWARISGVTLDVPDHALLTDLAQTIGAGAAYLVEEPADSREVADNGTWRQSALCPQIIFERFENLLVWRQPWRRRWRNRTFVAQYRQPSLERCPVTGLNRLSASSVPKVPLDHVLIDVGEHAATLCDPVQEAANHIEALPSTFASKPLFHQPPCIALDKFSVRPILETPEQPASSQVVFCFHRVFSAVESGKHRTNYAEPINCLSA